MFGLGTILNTLAVKAVLDFVIVVVFAATYGIGTACSDIAIFCLSGAHHPGGASDWQFCSRQSDFRFELCGFLPDFLRRHQSDLRQENKGWQPAACLAGTGCVCCFSGVVGGRKWT